MSAQDLACDRDPARHSETVMRCSELQPEPRHNPPGDGPPEGGSRLRRGAGNLREVRAILHFMKVAVPLLAPVLRSDVQGRLLAEVFADPDQEHTVTYLASRAKTSVPTAIREVDRAELAQLVTSRRVGNTRLVRRPRGEPALPALPPDHPCHLRSTGRAHPRARGHRRYRPRLPLWLLGCTLPGRTGPARTTSTSWWSARQTTLRCTTRPREPKDRSGCPCRPPYGPASSGQRAMTRSLPRSGRGLSSRCWTRPTCDLGEGAGKGRRATGARRARGGDRLRGSGRPAC